MVEIPLLEDLHVPCLFDQAGHFALLHGSKACVLAGQNLAGVGGVLGQGITVHEGIMLRIFTLGWGVCGFAHKGFIMNEFKIGSMQKFTKGRGLFSLTKPADFDFLHLCHESSIIH